MPRTPGGPGSCSSDLGVDRPTRSYFVGNEADRAREVTERLEAGETVALLTDAGTPGIADPGLTAVRAAVEAGAVITGHPGTERRHAGVGRVGPPGRPFRLRGLPAPQGPASVRADPATSGDEMRTVVLFCAPGRLAADLADLARGPRWIPGAPVVCRELTKLHEEIWRGPLDEAVADWSAEQRCAAR